MTTFLDWVEEARPEELPRRGRVVGLFQHGEWMDDGALQVMVEDGTAIFMARLHNQLLERLLGLPPGQAEAMSRSSDADTAAVALSARCSAWDYLAAFEGVMHLTVPSLGECLVTHLTPMAESRDYTLLIGRR